MNPYADLDRPPLRQPALHGALVVPGGFWRDIRVVAETGSTNTDVAALARDGAAEGLVLLAERQVAGRGRLDRQWISPPRAGLALSVLLRPAVAPARYGWLPLLAGVALVEAVRRVSEVDAYLKWPNDLMLPGDLKCGGILTEVVSASGGDVADAVVVGIGLNTSLRAEELPHPSATSLSLAGAACYDRDPLLRGILRALSVWYGRWIDAGGDPLRSGLAQTYKLHCATLGRQVRVALPDQAVLAGVAEDIDDDGRLVVTEDGGATGARRAVAAGDVVHVR